MAIITMGIDRRKEVLNTIMEMD